jgi:hypothetical protein
MRETSSLITTPTVKPTLEVVRHQFEAWRKRRRCRGRIPEALWEAAVGLCVCCVFPVSLRRGRTGPRKD